MDTGKRHFPHKSGHNPKRGKEKYKRAYENRAFLNWLDIEVKNIDLKVNTK